jgi:hypothetical protein
LTERSREISSRLGKLNISLEVTNNEFILGTIEGIENYARYREGKKTNAGVCIRGLLVLKSVIIEIVVIVKRSIISGRLE